MLDKLSYHGYIQLSTDSITNNTLLLQRVK